MEGAHKRQRQTSDLLVGDEGEAGEKRQRVQRGVGASGRRGQATQIRAASGKGISAQVRQDVAKAMQAGSALVQASLEHLETAERSWDKWAREHGIVIKNYPTEVQVLSYMAQMSRTRQRECLAQRGKRRSGGQKGSVRNYVSQCMPILRGESPPPQGARTGSDADTHPAIWITPRQLAS